jgi:hypothetical protein
MHKAEINKATNKKLSTPEIVLYGSFLFIVLIAYLIPVDVLQKYPKLQPFIDFMANWNMQIRRVGEISGPRSEINMAIYSMAWCLAWIPIGAYAWFMLANEPRNKIRLRTDESYLKYLLTAFGAGFFSWIAYTWPGQSWPIDDRSGNMIFLSATTSPIFSVGIVCTTILLSINFAILVLGVFLKLHRQFRD